MKRVEEYCAECEIGQCHKDDQKAVKAPEPFEAPKRHWKRISMDAVMQFPETEYEFDSITMFVGCFSKQVHSVASRTADTRWISHTVFENIFWLRDLPDSTVSARDSKHTAGFRQGIMRKWVINLKMFTSTNLQTDGLAETMNKRWKITFDSTALITKEIGIKYFHQLNFRTTMLQLRQKHIHISIARWLRTLLSYRCFLQAKW